MSELQAFRIQELMQATPSFQCGDMTRAKKRNTYVHSTRKAARLGKERGMSVHRLPIDTPSTTALLVVDMQVDFLDEKGRLPVDRTCVPHLVEHVNAAIAEAQARGALVVHVGNEFPRGNIANIF